LRTDDEYREAITEVHPLLAALSLAFWRMRLVVEREAGTIPLKLLILSIVRKKEVVSPGEICRRFSLDVSRVTRLTQSLEKEGLLKRERDPQDGRYLRLSLTEEGQAFVRNQQAFIQEEFERRLEGLSDEEIEQLERMLGVVAEGMKL
jgi:DNA-binding MarR family transcriptional regulator